MKSQVTLEMLSKEYPEIYEYCLLLCDENGWEEGELDEWLEDQVLFDGELIYCDDI